MTEDRGLEAKLELRGKLLAKLHQQLVGARAALDRKTRPQRLRLPGSVTTTDADAQPLEFAQGLLVAFMNDHAHLDVDPLAWEHVRHALWRLSFAEGMIRSAMFDPDFADRADLTYMQSPVLTDERDEDSVYDGTSGAEFIEDSDLRNIWIRRDKRRKPGIASGPVARPIPESADPALDSAKAFERKLAIRDRDYSRDFPRPSDADARRKAAARLTLENERPWENDSPYDLINDQNDDIAADLREEGAPVHGHMIQPPPE